jgi:hypothetical protein
MLLQLAATETQVSPRSNWISAPNGPHVDIGTQLLMPGWQSPAGGLAPLNHISSSRGGACSGFCVFPGAVHGTTALTSPPVFSYRTAPKVVAAQRRPVVGQIAVEVWVPQLRIPVSTAASVGLLQVAGTSVHCADSSPTGTTKPIDDARSNVLAIPGIEGFERRVTV